MGLLKCTDAFVLAFLKSTNAVDSLEFHRRTLVPLELELYLSSTGVPLENLRSAGAPGDAPGHCQGHVQVTELMDETVSGK